MSAKTQPIIIIKKKGGHGGHHGGAWKVAYADFVTAMMSLFIVLWLMGSSEKVKRAVAGYFNDPKGTGSQLGTTMTGTGATVSQLDTKDLEKLKEKLEEEIKARKDLEKLSKQIEIKVTPEGLRIELIEDKNGTFYQSGSAKLSESGQELLSLLAGELKTLPNHLLIEGHTDATPYSTDNSYSNWELSADRANSARRLLQQDGVRSDQVAQVRGYADQMLRMKDNPYDASNRRISILVQNGLTGGPPIIKNAQVVGGAAAKPAAETPASTEKSAPAPTEKPEAAAAPPPEAAPAPPAAPPPPAATKPAASAATAPAKAGLFDKITAMLPGKKAK
jgi:chemotaxis protein MotB